MKAVKNTRSVNVETLKDLQAIVEYISENERYQKDWIETVKDEGWEYGKKSLYYVAKKTLSKSDNPELELAMEFCQSFEG